MAHEGDTATGTAEETLAHLRANAASGLAIQMSFPHAGFDLYVAYFSDCGHYMARVVTFGADPSNPANIRTHEDGLEEHEVVWRMNLLMMADIRADAQGFEERAMLERMMIDEEGE